jgi:hypothetical protein
VRNRAVIESGAGSIVPTMTGLSRSDGTDGTRARAAGARRTSWFSRAKLEVRRSEDQEAEVREQLYARRAEPERSVRRVERIQPPARVEWIERPEPTETAGERVADRPAA